MKNGIVIIEVLLLLLPTTLLYLGGLLLALLVYFGEAGGGFQLEFLPFFAVLTLPGYGLYCLWWLVIKHRKITFQEVPKSIWAGVIAGSLIALLAVFTFAGSGFKSPTEFNPVKKNIELMVIYGGGPLIVALTLVVILRQRRGRGD